MPEKQIGKVVHYYDNIGVAILELSDAVKVGDTIHVMDGAVDFEQLVESMEMEHAPLESASKGQSVGLKVAEKVKEGATVYKLV